MTFCVENNTNHELPFQPEEILNKIAREVFCVEGFQAEAEISLMVVTKEEIQEMNRDYRGIDKVTDVLSFPNLSFENPGEFDLDAIADIQNPENGEIVLGDIVICYDRMKEQAEDYGHSLLREFAFLTAHSMYHLCGYDHMTEEEASVMEEKQKRVLETLGYTRDC